MTGRSRKFNNQEPENDILEEVQEELKNSLSNEDEDDGIDVQELSERDKPEQLKISQLEKDIFDYRDKLIRKAAEFENYKKRTSDEFIRLIETANEDLILKLLPVVDDIERFEKNFNDDIQVKDIKKGVDLIFEKFKAVLSATGLTEIEAVGKPFDPELHEAMMIVDNPEAEQNTVVDQHEKGYFLGKKVIRHTKVIVSK